MKHEKEKVLANLSLGDPNRLIFFQNFLKVDAELDFDKTFISQGNHKSSNSNSKMCKLKPISLSFNIFQNYNSMKKRNSSSVSKPPKANSLNDADINFRGCISKFATSKSKAQTSFPTASCK